MHVLGIFQAFEVYDSNLLPLINLIRTDLIGFCICMMITKFKPYCYHPSWLQVLQVMQEQDLLGLTRETGKVMLEGLQFLEQKYPQFLHSARGMGTICAIDSPTVAIR